MGMEWGSHRLQACALPPPPRGGRWKPRRSVPGVARGAGQRGRAAGRRQAAGGEEPATLLLSAEATGNRGRPNIIFYLFLFLPTAARSPHGSGQVARGRRGPEAACPAHPVTPALQDAAAGAARRTAYRSEEAAARLGFFPSAFPQPPYTRSSPSWRPELSGAPPRSSAEAAAVRGATGARPPTGGGPPLTAATVQYGTLD